MDSNPILTLTEDSYFLSLIASYLQDKIIIVSHLKYVKCLSSFFHLVTCWLTSRERRSKKPVYEATSLIVWKCGPKPLQYSFSLWLSRPFTLAEASDFSSANILWQVRSVFFFFLTTPTTQSTSWLKINPLELLWVHLKQKPQGGRQKRKKKIMRKETIMSFISNFSNPKGNRLLLRCLPTPPQAEPLQKGARGSLHFANCVSLEFIS